MPAANCAKTDNETKASASIVTNKKQILKREISDQDSNNKVTK